MNQNETQHNAQFPAHAPVANSVFYRTYSRKNGALRETWQEVCNRTITHLSELGKLTDEETALLIRMQTGLKALPSGRWLWVGGTDWIKKPENFYGGYNCSSSNVVDWRSFGLMMSLAMMGTGTGAVLERKYTNQLPPICNRLTIKMLGEIGATMPEDRRDETTTVIHDDGNVYMHVGDSRQGWVKSYQSLMELASAEGLGKLTVHIDLSDVRPAGEKLKGFGGMANPIRLPKLYERCAAILNKAVGRKLTPVECCLLIDEAAACVVAGNIRRCLPKGAIVTIDNNAFKAIEDIRVGDRVLTSKGYYPVVATVQQGIQKIARIHFEGDDDTFECTARHKVAVLNGWETNKFGFVTKPKYSMIRTKDLKPGHEMIRMMLDSDGHLLNSPSTIKFVEFDHHKEFTYDIEVAEVHEFIADGMLVSNSAGMRQFDADDIEAASAKDNLWQQDAEGNWRIDPERDVLRMANHTRVFHEKPTLDECIDAVTKQFYSGEGAIQWAGEAKRRAQGKGRYGLNPCLRGDMKLLTNDGYQAIASLVNKDVHLVNAEGNLSVGKVWLSGRKQVYEITLSTGKRLVATGDHRWMTADFDTVQTVDLVGKYLMPFENHPEALVNSVKKNGYAEVYDFSEPLTHWGVVEGYVSHNCGEIIGEDFLCDLAEVHLNQLDPFNFDDQIDAFKAGALDVAILLHHQFDEPRYQKSRLEDPIVGVSFTGLFDFFVKAFGVEWLHWWEAGRPEKWNIPQPRQKFTDRIIEIGNRFNEWRGVPSEMRQVSTSEVFKYIEQRYLKLWSKIVHDTVWEYCDRHELTKPNRCTTVQPAGTKSLLTGASPGWHPPKAQRFIRRVTFRKDDPVALACRDYGYSLIPSQSDKDDDGNLLNDPFDPRCTEWLVEMPVEVPWANMPGCDAVDISKFSVLAQFDFYMQVQQYYTAHNTSATLEMRQHEIKPLATRIYEAIQNNEGYISAALLARFDDLQTFPRLPFEPIDKATYEQLCQQVSDRQVESDFYKALCRYDAGEIIEAGPAGCDSDKCMMPEFKPNN